MFRPAHINETLAIFDHRLDRIEVIIETLDHVWHVDRMRGPDA